MTLNYQVIVERYSFPNGVVDGSIPIVKSSLYLTEEKSAREVKNQEPTQHEVGSKPHPAPKGFLSRVGPNRLKFTSDRPTLVIYLFIHNTR